MATDLLSLVARIGIDDSEYNKGVDGAESKAKKLAGGMKSAFKIGAAAVGVTATAIGGLSKSIFSAAKQTAEYGDTIDKQSQRVGLSAEAYQKWDYVMKIAGSEMSNMRMGLKTLTNQLGEAQSGSKEAQENFARLGISMNEVNNMSREEAFGAVIKGFQQMGDTTERAALANKLFGRSGQELAPLFNQTAESTDALLRKAEDYGMVMSNDAVKASADFQDSLTTLSQTTTGLKNRLMGEFMPSITKITDGLALMFTRDGREEGLEKFTKGISDTIDNFGELVPKLLELGVPILESIATGIIDNLPKLATTMLDVVVKLATYVLDNAQHFASVAIELIYSLADGLLQNIPTLIPAVVQVVQGLVDMLLSPESLEKLIMCSVELITTLETGLIEALPQLLEMIPTIIINMGKALIKAAPKLQSAGVRLMAVLINSIKSVFNKLRNVGSEIIDKIKSAIQSKINTAKSWGRDLIQNFIDGIKEKFQAVKDSFTSIANLAKKILGHSTPEAGPMKDDDEWMPDFMDNLANGINLNKYKVTNALDDLAGDMVLGGDYGFTEENSLDDRIQLELSVDDRPGAMGALARAIFPFLVLTAKEKGVALS